MLLHFLLLPTWILWYGSQAATITELKAVRETPFATGVHLAKSETLCFPSEQWILRGRFPYSRFFRNLLGMLVKMKSKLGSIGTTADNAETVAERTCVATSRVNNLCPLSAITTVVEKFGKQKATLLTWIRSLANKFSEIRDAFEQLPKAVKTIVPFVSTSKLQDISPWNESATLESDISDIMVNKPFKTILLPLSNDFKANGWFGIMERLQLNAEKTDFTNFKVDSDTATQETLDAMREVLVYFSSKVKAVEQMLENVSEKKLPIALFGSENILSALQTIATESNTEFQDDEQLRMLHLLPLSYAIHKPCESNCMTDIFIVVPIIKPTDKFQVAQIHTVPVAGQQYTGDAKWKQIQLNSNYVLTHGTERFEIEGPDDYQCSENEGSADCPVCYFKDLPDKPVSPCLMKIMSNEDPKDFCEFKTVSEPNEDAVAVAPQEYLFTDPTPGVLTEKCGNSAIKAYDLPYSGIMDFNSSCVYNMVNGPFKDRVPYIPGVRITTSVGQKDQQDIRTLKDDITELKKHFRDHGYIYIIVFGSILGLTSSVLLYLCVRKLTYIHRRRSRRNRRRQERNVQYSAMTSPSMATNQQESSEALILPQRVFRQAQFALRAPPRFETIPGGVQLMEVETV